MSSYCCATCHHFQTASVEEEWAWRHAPKYLARGKPTGSGQTIGWCWWLIDHPGMKYEVPEWMLPRDLAPDGAGPPRVALAADDGARCAQWRARLGRRDWAG
jgi:hypothetical protein